MTEYYQKFESKFKRLEELLNNKPADKKEANELFEWLEGEISAINDRLAKNKHRLIDWSEK